MKHPLLFIVCIILQVNLAFTQSGEQQQKAFDSIFYHTYMNMAATAPNRALEVADSLYRTSVDDIQRIRSLMLISDMHWRKANRDSTVYYALKADQIASDARIYVWQARIYGVLSTQHRKNGLLKQGRKFLEKGLQVSKKIEKPNISNQFQGHVYQEKGFYAEEENNFREAIQNFKKANTFFLNTADSFKRATFLAQSEERLGKYYLKLNMPDSARYHYTNGLKLENEASKEETVIKGFIYNGLGMVYLKQKDHKTAHDFLCKGLDIALAANFADLKIEVYEALALYYKAVNDIDNYALYNEKHREIVGERIAKDRSYANNMVAKTELKLERLIFSRRAIAITMSALLILTIVGGGLFYRNKRKKEYHRFQKIIREIREQNKETEQVNKQVEEPEAQDRNTEEKELMPRKTEELLLKRLSQFELSEKFTNKNISLSVLSGKLETNTKYLSYIIKKHKGKDFNTYINDLRIRYIIKKIEKDPDYLNYKISYLAEECGFSSHSKFTTIFKSITGLTPSTFMAYLNKSKKKKIPAERI